MLAVEEIPMHRILIALVWLSGMTLTADAAAWSGAASLAAAAPEVSTESIKHLMVRARAELAKWN